MRQSEKIFTRARENRTHIASVQGKKSQIESKEGKEKNQRKEATHLICRFSFVL